MPSRDGPTCLGVHSLAPRDGSTYLRAHSPSLEPFCSDVCLCPSHVRQVSTVSLQKTTLFFVALIPTPTLHTSLMSLGANNVLILSLGISGRPRRREGVLLSEQSQMSVLDLCLGLGYKSQKLEA